MSTAVHITRQGAQIKFGDLPPYLNYRVPPFRLGGWESFAARQLHLEEWQASPHQHELWENAAMGCSTRTPGTAGAKTTRFEVRSFNVKPFGINTHYTGSET